jgi:hypothetical protein
MPVEKVSLPTDGVALSESFDATGKSKRHTMFSGTTVLQAADPGVMDKSTGQQQETLALVIGTAINTR